MGPFGAISEVSHHCFLDLWPPNCLDPAYSASPIYNHPKQKIVIMSDTIFEKKPAFFRVTSAEMFFEADAEVAEDIQLDEAIEKEIDDLIAESAQSIKDKLGVTCEHRVSSSNLV
jgi:hypothetical protein